MLGPWPSAGRRLLRAIAIAVACLLAGVMAWAPDADGWERIETPATGAFQRVQVDADGTVWLLGERIHQRRPDGSWAPPVSIPGEGWADMAVAGASRMFGLTPYGGALEVMRDGTVSRLLVQPACVSLNAVMVTSGRTVAAGCPYYSGFAMWRTDDSAALEEVGGLAPWDLTLIGEDDAVTVGLQGVSRVQRGAGKPVTLADDRGLLRLVWADRTHLVTLDSGGAFEHATWDAATNRIGMWITHPVPDGTRLNRLWGRSADDLYAVGQAGAILHFDGASWTSMASGVTVSLFSIAGNAREVWVAGDHGTLLRLLRGNGAMRQ